MSEQKWRYGRPRPFWPWPVGFALVLFALGGAALAVLWGALERYEESTPRRPSCAACRQCSPSPAERRGCARGGAAGRFATAAQYLEEARTLLNDLPADRDSLRFVRKGEADGAEEYVVVDEEGGRVEFLLFPQEKGWQAWPKVQALSTVTIRAPLGVTLTVDGRPLEESERSETSAAPGFEALGDAAPQECVWQVEGLLEQPEVTAQSEAGSCRVEWETPLNAVVTVEPNGEDAALS